MPSFFKHLLILAAVLTVGASQVFGISRGWQCLCSGEALPSPDPQCETAACGCDTAREHECGDPAPSPKGEHHQHVAVADAVESVPFAPLAVKLPDFTPWEPPFFFLVNCFGEGTMAEVPDELIRPPGDKERDLPGPTDPVKAAKCAVLVV